MSYFNAIKVSYLLVLIKVNPNHIYIYTKQSSKSTEAKTHKESNSTLENFKAMQHPKNVHYKRPPKEANWKKKNY